MDRGPRPFRFIAGYAQQPAAALLCRAKLSDAERCAEQRLESGEAALAHGVLPFRAGLRQGTRSLPIGQGDRGLGPDDLPCWPDPARSQVDVVFLHPRFAAKHGPRLAWGGSAGHDHGFRRLDQFQHHETRGIIGGACGAQQRGRLLDLAGVERVERMCA